MRIATLSKADSTGGGASKVAQTLSDGFVARGLPASHLCVFANNGFGQDRVDLYGGGLASRAVKAAHSISRGLGLSDSIPFEAPAALRRLPRGGWDVLHVHDTTTALSPLTLQWLAARHPTVWTMHDASPVTGGCIQPMDCQGFKSGCGRCPQADLWPISGAVDATRLHHGLRRRLHATGRVHLVAPSEWMADLAVSSGLIARRPTVIPNPIRTEEYAPPTDRDALRVRKGIPTGRLVLVTSAGSLLDPRKGVRHALEAVGLLGALSPFLILVGAPAPDLAGSLAGIDHVATGHVRSTSELADWYACADAFVYCAAIDNQPLTVLETQACAVPTFGFAVGGTPELVDQGRNGVLVPHGDVPGLASALAAAVAEGSLPAMGAAGRRFVTASFGLDRVLDLHLELYRDIATERAAA